MVKRGDDDSRPSYVMDSAWENDPIVAEMAIKPGVVEKLGSLFRDPIMVRVRSGAICQAPCARGYGSDVIGPSLGLFRERCQTG